jgi:hypothetical protein
MNHYEYFSPDAIRVLKKLNDEMLEEEKKCSPDKNKILKLKQQILMKGIEMSNGFNI